MRNVAVNILTGFLGSGKTTLLRHVLKHGLDGRRVAVIVNEIGDLGVDGKLVRGHNVERMVELNSGCICCTINVQLAVAVDEILEATRPDVLLIETTGAADPYPLMEEVDAIGLSIDAVTCVVDAANFLSLVKESKTAADQVRAADFVVINKLDLVDERQLQAVRQRVRRLNKRAHVVETRFGEVSHDILFATCGRTYRERAEEAPESGGHGHLESDHIQSFIYESDEPLERRTFERWLKRLPKELYRAKGIVRFGGEASPSLMNFVCGRSYLDWFRSPDPDRPLPTQLVFIGHGILDHRETIVSGLESCKVGAPPSTLWGRLRARLAGDPTPS